MSFPGRALWVRSFAAVTTLAIGCIATPTAPNFGWTREVIFEIDVGAQELTCGDTASVQTEPIEAGVDLESVEVVIGNYGDAELTLLDGGVLGVEASLRHPSSGSELLFPVRLPTPDGYQALLLELALDRADLPVSAELWFTTDSLTVGDCSIMLDLSTVSD